MYGKWLFKEIKTEYGLCKVEIFRKNFTDTAIEIGALESNSLTLAMENLGNITDPIGKSVCSFSIIDTDQIDYDEFFTPDATAYMVVVSTKTGEGAYVTRWSGYITPDFFAENLSYRTPISISARDNIGYLNDVDFDLDASTITVRGLIEAAFNRIAEDYPMQIVFATQKQTAEGVLAIDATISTMLLREGSWYEAIETILHDLGLQMRWVDNNTIAVLDLSQIPEYYATQAFNFVDASGYREILPAWRELAQKQDYGLRENFFEGQFSSENLTFVKSQHLTIPDLSFEQDVRYYTPNNWGVARDIYTTDPSFYNTTFGEKIIFSAVSKDNPATTYLSWQTNILKSGVPLTVKFNALNTIVYPFGGYNPYPLQLKVYDPFLAFGSQEGDGLQIGLRMNLFLHTKGHKTYVMNKEWVEDDGTGSGHFINFTLDKVSLDSYQYEEGKGFFPIGNQPAEKELSIVANTIPYDGVLELRIYGYYVVNYKYGADNVHNPNFDKFFTHINNVTYTFESEDISTGQDAGTKVGEMHNVKENAEYKFGQVAYNCGGINAYAGGLFDAEGRELLGFQRNTNATNYSLLELVGREVIHFNKKNYNKLSGTIRNLAKEPLMFNRLFVRNGKRYAPFAYSLNIISNQMEITTMQEVENYVTESFSEINSAVTTGGAIVSAGNNTVMQYSQDAGNTKRIYELTAATEEEKKDTWVMIDGTAFPEARKINVKDLEGLNEEQVEAYLTENAYAKESWVTNITKGLAQDIANRVLYEDFEKLEDAVDDNRQSIGVVQGYFNNGVANDASKLGGKAPSHYATASALGTTNTNVDNVAARVATLEGNFKGGDAKNALKLGEHLPEYFATAEGLSTVDSALTAAKNRVTTLEGYFTSGIAKEAAKVSNALTFGSKTFNGSSAQTILASDLDAVTTAGAQTITGAKTFSALITANGGIAVPKTKSIKVGDAELVWDDTIKALKVVGAMYTTGTFAFGGDEEPESGGGGAAGIVTVRVNGYDYNSVNGIVTLPDYPSLAGYATEDYVTSRGYITNAALNGYAKLTDIPTSLPASDVYAWAKKSALAIDDVPDLSSKYLSLAEGGIVKGNIALNVSYNYIGTDILDKNFQEFTHKNYFGYISLGPFNDLYAHIYTDKNQFYFNKPILINGSPVLISHQDVSHLLSKVDAAVTYLPLSGGTINSDSYVPLTLNANSSQSRMQFQIQGVDKALVGWNPTYGAWLYSYPSGAYLHIKDDGTPCYNGYTLYHTGNFNPANYLPLGGGKISGTTNTPLVVGTSATKEVGIRLDMSDGNKAWIGYTPTTGVYLYHYNGSHILGIKDDGTPNYNGNPLIHAGNIGSYNAGSAKVLKVGNSIYADADESSYSKFGVSSWTNYIDGSEIKLRYGSSLVTGLVVNSSGNVLTGTTTDAGYKFAVNGDTLTNTVRTQELRLGEANPDGSITQNKWYYASIGYEYTDASPNTLKPDIIFKTMYDTYAGGSGVERMRIKSNGNILMGATMDNGAKLQVNGRSYIGNSEVWKHIIKSGNNTQSSEVYALKVIQGTDCGSGLYDTMIITSSDVATLRLSESDGTQMGICAGDQHTTFTSTHDFRFFTGVSTNQPVYSGGYGAFKVGINYEGAALYVNGNLTVTGGATFGGDVAINGALAWSSDIRLKDNVTYLSAEHSLGIIRQLKPTSWNWKKDGKTSFGLIAQEVQTIIPEMVTNGEYLHLQYNHLHAFEIGAIQYIDTKVERLEKRVAELENELKQYRRN